MDKGYDYSTIRPSVTSQRFIPHIRTRGEEIEEKTQNPDWRARRWVVEACHSWLSRNRAILIRWSKKDESHEALLQLASGLIALKRAHAWRLANPKFPPVTRRNLAYLLGSSGFWGVGVVST